MAVRHGVHLCQRGHQHARRRQRPDRHPQRRQPSDDEGGGARDGGHVSAVGHPGAGGPDRLLCCRQRPTHRSCPSSGRTIVRRSQRPLALTGHDRDPIAAGKHERAVQPPRMMRAVGSHITPSPLPPHTTSTGDPYGTSSDGVDLRGYWSLASPDLDARVGCDQRGRRLGHRPSCGWCTPLFHGCAMDQFMDRYAERPAQASPQVSAHMAVEFTRDS